MTWKQTLPEIEQTITADSAGGLIMAFILYVIVVFVMFGTVLMMTEERKYEFGVLISIGMSRLRLFGIILCETIILSITPNFNKSLAVIFIDSAASLARSELLHNIDAEASGDATV